MFYNIVENKQILWLTADKIIIIIIIIKITTRKVNSLVK